MATIITRVTGATAKGSALTNAEMDQNLINIATQLGDDTPTVNQSDVGFGPNQIPTNSHLGSMAQQDENSVTILGGVATLTESTVLRQYNNTEIGNVNPSLLLDFAKARVLDPRITFSRSGSPASYYDGKTFAVAEQNLALYSQDYTQSAWTKTNVTISASAALAPDGTMTASLVTSASTTNPQISQSIGAVSGAYYVVSFYARQGSERYFQLRDNQSAADYAIFDLQGGTVTQNGSFYTTSMTSIGNGWYRCVAVISNAVFSTGNVAFILAFTDNRATPGYTQTITTTSGLTFYLWGFQVEQRSAVCAYTPTTSSAITNYIPALQYAAANMPRFDYDPITGEAKGLLVEEQRTNLMTYSSQFDNAAWTKGSVTVTADCIVAPDGTLTGDKIVQSAGSAQHVVYQSPTTTGTLTLSYYAKAGERTWSIGGSGSNGKFVYVNLLTGAFTVDSGVTASVTPVLNGWYRITVTYTIATTSSWGIYAASSASYTDTGDGTSGIYIWGAQLEAGAFATSYIPTTSAQVTRTADAPSMTGTNFSQWYNPNEGTLVVEATAPYLPTNGVVWPATIKDSGNSNAIQLQLSNTSTYTNLDVWSGGIESAIITSTNVTAGLHKVVGAYKVNDFSAALDGVLLTPDSSGTVPIVDRLLIGAGRLGATGNSIWIKSIKYYPKRLPDAELQEMTL